MRTRPSCRQTPPSGGPPKWGRRRPTSAGGGRLAQRLDNRAPARICLRLNVPSCTPPTLTPPSPKPATERKPTLMRRASRGTPPEGGNPCINWATTPKQSRQTTSTVGSGGKSNRCPVRGHTHQPHHPHPPTCTQSTTGHRGDPCTARARHTQWLGTPPTHWRGGRVAPVPASTGPRHLEV